MQPRRFALIGHQHTADDIGGLDTAITDAIAAASIDDLVDVNVPSPNDGDGLVFDTGTGMWIAAPATADIPNYVLGAGWTAGLTAIVTPTNDVQVRIPATGTIRKVTILPQGGSGSCVIDIWKDTFAHFPPVVGDSIVSPGTVPQISSSSSPYEDSTFTNWTHTDVTAGETLTFHLTSCSTFTNVVVLLDIEPS